MLPSYVVVVTIITRDVRIKW